MTSRRLLILAAAGAAATTLVFAGCGGSSDPATSTADTAAAASTAAADTTATTDTTSTTSGTVKQVDCVGAEEACSLKIPIGGGVSNQAYEVALTGTNLGEPTITPDTATDEGAYDLSGAKFTTGGSIYSFTLDSVQSLPEGAYITLDFATKK
ncbi:MAG: hypothetical protein JHC53_03245 [Thermoleophilia bacterium]|nr:hypothetical protein [Thermoleophilia bacterium]